MIDLNKMSLELLNGLLVAAYKQQQLFIKSGSVALIRDKAEQIKRIETAIKNKES